MNYVKIYNNLIDRASTRVLPDNEVEHHHIIPRCMGGTDDVANIADLTPEEHYVAHQLLVKIYPSNNKLVYAAFMMSVANATMKRNNKLYGWIKRKRFSEPMPQETRDKISSSLSGRTRAPVSAITREKLKGPNPLKANFGPDNGFYGKTHTNDTLMHLSAVCGIAAKGKPKSKEACENMKASFTAERRIMLSENRKKLNLTQSDEHKSATKLSNITRGIQKQKSIMTDNIAVYDMLFNRLLENIPITEIYKELGIEYKLVWKIKNKFEYFYKIYLEVKNLSSAQDNSVDNLYK